MLAILRFIPAALWPAAKAVVAALVAVLSVVVTGLVTGNWDDTALAAALIGLFSAAGVYVVAAIPALKAVVAAVLVLVGLVITGLFTNSWDNEAIAGAITAVISAGFAALLVYGVPNIDTRPVDPEAIGPASDSRLPDEVLKKMDGDA